jgi:hypothetical protein
MERGEEEGYLSLRYGFHDMRGDTCKAYHL